MRQMIKCWMLLVAISVLPAMGAESPKEIYLLIGQSNMAGRAKVTPELAGPLDGVMLLNQENQWEVAQNPLNRYSTIRKGLKMQQLGPGYGFAREMRKQRPDATIGLIVNAKGGTKIESWAEGGTFFNDAVTRAKAAIEAGGVLKGILWHQGESNANDPEYVQKASALISALRKALGDENLPFVVGETCTAGLSRPVNKLLNEIPNVVPNTACVSADGLTAHDVKTHFDTESQLELGRRYAVAILALLN